MGGMFGAIARPAALAERQRTGRGREVQSALFENNVFLMAQPMMFETVTGQPSIPYSVKDSPWPVYDLFDTRDGSKLFVTIVGEEQWEAFCRAFDRDDLARRSALRRPARTASTSAAGSFRRSRRSSSNGQGAISPPRSSSSICLTRR